ncbi:MAG: DNRLRE domain-containing protein [Phycisphaera sp.]|nr:DNRLRE domain-containing protein [Phycisphaera sp.]
MRLSTQATRSPANRPAARLMAAAVSALALAASHAADADQKVLVSVADNTIIEDPTGAFSAGAAQYFFAGRVNVNGGGTLRRGALRFDLTSIPAGSTITSVSLRLYCSAAGNSTSQPISFKRFTASWGEGASVAFGGGGAAAQSNDVTWQHRFYPGTAWATPGGQFVATASATRNVTGMGFYTWASTPGLVADVQGWVNAPATNFGWCVQGNEGTMQSVKRFDSREAGAATRPQLTVVYTLPPSNPADLNNDNAVNAVDLALLLGAWGTAGPGDIDGNGTVNAADLAALLGAWTGV